MDLSNELNQIGGKVFICYADTAQNRKLKRVGKLYKYKHTYAAPVERSVYGIHL